MEADFETAAPADHANWYRSPTEFDRRLLHCAVSRCVSVLGQLLRVAPLYSWAADASAFGSGVEAWLQYEFLLSLTVAARDDPVEPTGPVVFRVVRDARRSSWAVRGQAFLYLMVSTSVIDRHVALFAAMSATASASPRRYNGDNGWTKSNTLGGGSLEALVRGEDLGVAWALAENFLTATNSYAASDQLGEPEEWVPTSRPPAEVIKRIDAPWSFPTVEALVRGPLRFAALHRWASEKWFPDDAPRIRELGRTSEADRGALVILTRLTNDVQIHGLDRSQLTARNWPAVAMAAHLQAERLGAIQAAYPGIVEWLCVERARGTPPVWNRLGRLQVTQRCISVRPAFPERSESLTYHLLAAVDEIQIFVGLVAGVALSRLGGSVWLESLCRGEWLELMEYLGGDLEVPSRIHETSASSPMRHARPSLTRVAGARQAIASD